MYVLYGSISPKPIGPQIFENSLLLAALFLKLLLEKQNKFEYNVLVKTLL